MEQLRDGKYGLVRAINAQQLVEAEAQQAQEYSDLIDQPEQFTSELARHIRKDWETNRNYKHQEVLPRLLDCLRARQGVYDDATLRAIREQGGSEIYMRLTAVKCRAAASWINDILFPADDKAWGVEPTPLPDLPPEIVRLINMKVSSEIQRGMEMGVPMDENMVEEYRGRLEDMVRTEARERAKTRAERMERKIEDQLAEGNWKLSLREFIDDFVTFPTAFLKGPIAMRRPTLKWGPNFQPERGSEIGYTFKRVSPFDIYPAPGARNLNDGPLLERERFTRMNLYDMIGTPGYDEEGIRETLRKFRDQGLQEWMWDDQERFQVEAKTQSLWRSNGDDGMIDALIYHGAAPGSVLLEWGIKKGEIDDPEKEYEIEAILVDSRVIRCRLNKDPLCRRPYYGASYNPTPGGLWGLAIPELMEDVQRVCNATARALVNNLAIASGPQVIADVRRMAEGEDWTNIYPWKIWETRTDAGAPTGSLPVQFYQPSSNASELLAVFEQFERRADDLTNIPRYTYGNERVGGAGNTASGLSMLMDSTTKGIRAAIGHIDGGVITQAIEMLWTKNMMYEDDPEIKGDVKIVARGSSSLVSKEARRQRAYELLSATANELDHSIMGNEGRAEMLRELFTAANMPGVIPDREELKANLEAQAKNQQPPPEILKAQMEDARLREEMELDAQIDREQMQTDVHIAGMRNQQHQAKAATGSNR